MGSVSGDTHAQIGGRAGNLCPFQPVRWPCNRIRLGGSFLRLDPSKVVFSVFFPLFFLVPWPQPKMGYHQKTQTAPFGTWAH